MTLVAPSKSPRVIVANPKSCQKSGGCAITLHCSPIWAGANAAHRKRGDRQ